MERYFYLFLVIGLLGAGCATRQTEPPPVAPVEDSVVDVRADEAMGSEIRRRLNAAGGSELLGVVVEISNGVVILRGSAPTAIAAWRAEGIARSVAGVRRVQNEIWVGTSNR